MKRIFLDTNFVIDYLLRDDYKPVCQRFLEEGIRRRFTFCISFLSVANFAYVARHTPKEELYRYVSALCQLFEIVPNTSQQIDTAVRMKASDFEDALQYRSAVDAGCDCIITRNQKDFSFSTLPVCSAAEFLDRLHA